MNKKLVVFVGLLVITLLTIPVMAKKPVAEEITYFRKVEVTVNTEGHGTGSGNSNYVVTNSTRTGSIYDGTDVTGTKIFDFTQYGSCQMNLIQGYANWHFTHVWTIPGDPDSGFKGRLNGKAASTANGGLGYGWYEVSGVLHGFGECIGQKLVIQMARIPPNDALVTGTLYS